MKDETLPLVRHRRTPEQAKELVAKQERDGTCDAEFAAAQGIAVSTLVTWRRRHRSERVPHWVEVDGGTGMKSDVMAQVRLSDGLCVDLNTGFNAELMAELIGHLRKG